MSIYRAPTAADGTKFKKRIASKQLALMVKREQRAAERVAVAAKRRGDSMSQLFVPKKLSLIAVVSKRVGSIRDEPVRAVLKAPRWRNAAVLSLARGKPCLLLSPICRPDPETTVACHGAGLASGKGLGYKLGDQWTVWGCDQCNHYTDAYNRATADEKNAVFEAGHGRQVTAWQQISGDPKAQPRDRKAAQSALDEWALSIARKEAKNVSI